MVEVYTALKFYLPHNLDVEGRPLLWVSTTDPKLISLESQFLIILASTEARGQ